MKKVCFFMDTPFTLGGEQRVVTILANYLVEHSYDVSFLLTGNEKTVDYDLYKLSKKVNLIYISEYNRFFNRLLRKIYNLFAKINYKFGLFKNNTFILKKIYCNELDRNIILKYLNDYKFDYIIGIASKYYGILSILKPKIDCRVVAWQHSCYDAYFMTNGRRFYNQENFVNYMFNNVDYYIVQTNDDQKKIKKNHNYKALKINNPNTYQQTVISKLNNNNFIAVGRFSFVKGFDQLIEAFSLFAKENHDWNLYLVGDGDERKKYENLILKYNLNDRIFMPGKISDVSEMYLNSSIYVMTSLWEGWGMVVTEAMMHGLPVISYDLPSSREIFGNSECGIIVEKENIKKLAESMIYLVNNLEKRMTMSKKSVEQVKKFDIEIIGEEWKKVLK